MGAEDWPDIEAFGKCRHDWLKGFLQLPAGIPSHDTFRRVLGLLDRKQFPACLFQWTQALHEATGGKVLAIDGKTARRSFAKRKGRAALHLVTAWAGESGLTLGQVPCEEKSNEITAIPELLKLLDIRGQTVTIDAMGCQKEIAAQIRQQKGHYVLAMKGNQPGLEEDMQQMYLEAIDKDFAAVKHEECETTEKAHGRTTTRNVHVVEIPNDHPQRQHWKDLRTLVVVTTCNIQEEKENWGTRWYVSSHSPKARPLASDSQTLGHRERATLGVRHYFWRGFAEAAGSPRAANLAAVRRLAATLLRQEKTNKRGVKNKALSMCPQSELPPHRPSQFTVLMRRP